MQVSFYVNQGTGSTKQHGAGEPAHVRGAVWLMQYTPAPYQTLTTGVCPEPKPQTLPHSETYLSPLKCVVVGQQPMEPRLPCLSNNVDVNIGICTCPFDVTGVHLDCVGHPVTAS